MLLMTDDPDAVLAKVLAAQASGALPAALTPIRGSPPFFVELLRGDVCKGNGLKRLCELRGIDAADAVAFGDGENDVEFVSFAGVGIAMKNGRDAVKAVADRVTSSTNGEDGVARAPAEPGRGPAARKARGLLFCRPTTTSSRRASRASSVGVGGGGPRPSSGRGAALEAVDLGREHGRGHLRLAAPP
ncbi:phosphatase [Aureococcus anophagefferens]|nr:phosphatase [Aureococcus anophagefferens]